MKQKSQLYLFLCHLFFLCLLVCVLSPQRLEAVEPDEILQNTVLEQRARSISSGLRCLVCQNQSIDDSDAPLAKDLRVLVRERLSAGDTDQQVTDYIVERYGQFVLLKPPFNTHTLLLWVTPFFLLLIGLSILLRVSRSRNADMESRYPLSEAEEKELGKILLQVNETSQKK